MITNIEGAIVTRLSHPDSTILQLLVPKIILEAWEPEKLLKEFEEEENKHTGEEKIRARLVNLCCVSLLLLDIIPTWGVWDRPPKKEKLRLVIAELKKKEHSMEGDPWQGMPHQKWEDLAGFKISKENYTEVFYQNTGWRTHYPLCDFIREIELEKGHIYY